MTDLKKSKTELEKIIRELLLQMTRIFTDSFERLNAEFGKTFAEMFGGGKGELILLDPDDVLNCGIDIRVAPPGKIIKNIVALSGGEQAFTAKTVLFLSFQKIPSELKLPFHFIYIYCKHFRNAFFLHGNAVQNVRLLHSAAPVSDKRCSFGFRRYKRRPLRRAGGSSYNG